MTVPEQFQRVDGLLFRSGYAAQEIMPADPVKAQLEGRMHLPLLQFVQQCFVQKPAVGVKNRNRDLPLGQRVQNLEEILPDQGFAAGDPHGKDAALRQLVHHLQQLFLRGRSVFGVGRGHEAVPAFQVAGSRDRPVHMLPVARRIGLVFLLRLQIVQEPRFPDHVVFLQLFQEFCVFFRQGAFVDIVHAVAVKKQKILLFQTETGFFSAGVVQSRGGFVPAPQAVLRVDDVFHG